MRAHHLATSSGTGRPGRAALAGRVTAAVHRSAVHDVLRSPGQPLPAPLNEEMETRLGADFSQVRVHTDDAALASAAEIGARAYTSGNHVVIGPGLADRHTLAHELTHVIQQRQGAVSGRDDGSGLSISDPSDCLEHDAEATAVRVMRASPSARGAAPATATEQSLTAFRRQPGAWAADSLPGGGIGALRPSAGTPIVQRYPRGRSGGGSIELTTYGEVMAFIGADTNVGYVFLDHIYNAPEHVEAFLELHAEDSFEYDNADQLLDELADFIDADEGEGDLGGGPEEDVLEPQPRTARKGGGVKRKGVRPRSPLTPEQRLLDEFAGMGGRESTASLNPIDSLQEGVFSNLYQGGKESDFQHVARGPNLKRLSVAQKFLEGKGDANYKKQLERARNKILEGRYLVRKMSVTESRAFREAGGDRRKMFPAGIEGMKAFRIDVTYDFTSAERNARREDYEVVMRIWLSPQLKTYFINFLSANVANPLGVSDSSLRFSFNPQFKYENDDVTILIPPSGWRQFWSFVNNDTTFS
jgi:hypothetical protein